MSFSTDLLLTCASIIEPSTMQALVQVESTYNPYAIAVVDGEQIKQPKTYDEAVFAIDKLEQQGLNYSVGLGQVNKSNFKKYGTDGKKLLDPCENLTVSSLILSDCFLASPNKSVAEALSCYYAGNFSYGFVKEKKVKGYTSYVERVINALKSLTPKKEIIVPSLADEIPQALAKVREPKKKEKSTSTYSKCEDPNLIWNADDYKEICILGKTGGAERVEYNPVSQKSFETKTAKKSVKLKAVEVKPRTTSKLIKNPVVLDSEIVQSQSKTTGTTFKF